MPTVTTSRATTVRWDASLGRRGQLRLRPPPPRVSPLPHTTPTPYSARVVKPELGARHLEAMGRSCMQYVEEVVWRLWSSARVFLLGQTPMPQWTRDMGSDRVQARCAPRRASRARP